MLILFSSKVLPGLIVIFCFLFCIFRWWSAVKLQNSFMFSLSISQFVLPSSWKSYISGWLVDFWNQFWYNVEFFNFLMIKCQISFQSWSVGSVAVRPVTCCDNGLFLSRTVWPWNQKSYFKANWVTFVNGKRREILQASTWYRTLVQPFTILFFRRNLLSLVYTERNNEITGSRKSKRDSVSIDMSIM